MLHQEPDECMFEINLFNQQSGKQKTLKMLNIGFDNWPIRSTHSIQYTYSTCKYMYHLFLHVLLMLKYMTLRLFTQVPFILTQHLYFQSNMTLRFLQHCSIQTQHLRAVDSQSCRHLSLNKHMHQCDLMLFVFPICLFHMFPLLMYNCFSLLCCFLWKHLWISRKVLYKSNVLLIVLLWFQLTQMFYHTFGFVFCPVLVQHNIFEKSFE